jgi:hypothetical protein
MFTQKQEIENNTGNPPFFQLMIKSRLTFTGNDYFNSCIMLAPISPKKTHV